MPATSAFLQNWLEPIFGRWLYVDSMLWTVVGFLGAAIFGSRFILQWLQSEKEKKLVVPWYFWHLSFWGSVLNVLYFLHLDKAPLILGNCFLPFLYGRNILFLRRAGTKGGGRKVFAAVAVLVLAGFAWSVFFGDDGIMAHTGEDRTRRDLNTAASALQAYHEGHSKLPEGDTRSILKALRETGPNNPAYLSLEDKYTSPSGDWLDRWGHPYQILSSGNIYLIRSAGENGVFDDYRSQTHDDITLQGTAP